METTKGKSPLAAWVPPTSLPDPPLGAPVYGEDINYLFWRYSQYIYNKARNPGYYSDNVCIIPETEATRTAKTSAYNMAISLSRKNFLDCWSLSSHLLTYKTIGDDASPYQLIYGRKLWNDELVTDFSEIWIYRRFVTLYQKMVLGKSTPTPNDDFIA
jgi:hypothetical protein